MLDPFDKIPDALKAKPKRLDAGIAVTFPGEEATDFERVEEDLDLPSAALSFDQLNQVVKGLRSAVGQQSPLDRLDAIGRDRLLGHQAGRRHLAALAVSQADGTGKELLADGETCHPS